MVKVHVNLVGIRSVLLTDVLVHVVMMELVNVDSRQMQDAGAAGYSERTHA